MVALRETIRRFDIPPRPFLDLLVAFEQDQTVHSYTTFSELLGYCKNSANPVFSITSSSRCRRRATSGVMGW